MKRFFCWVASSVLSGIILELLAPYIRERAERRRLVKRRRRFREECAGPGAAYCELHGECHRCCEAAVSTGDVRACPIHGVQPV